MCVIVPKKEFCESFINNYFTGVDAHSSGQYEVAIKRYENALFDLFFVKHECDPPDFTDLKNTLVSDLNSLYLDKFKKTRIGDTPKLFECNEKMKRVKEMSKLLDSSLPLTRINM